jgi:putative endonuclease
MYYIYVLLSVKDKNLYVGYTINLKQRLNSHMKGAILSTKNRRPLEIVYYEASLNQKDALGRERYLKSSWGKRYLKNRIKNYLSEMNQADS